MVKNKYMEVGPFKEGLARVKDHNYRYGFIDTKGKEVSTIYSTMDKNEFKTKAYFVNCKYNYIKR